MTTPHKQTGSSSFFLKERDRLIAEIGDGIEQLLGNTNTLNRKLEESITVGQDFEPIANLWGRFVDMMSSSGISPQTVAEATAGAQQQSEAQLGSERQGGVGAGVSTGANPLGRSTASDDTQETLPPGIAPGGGTIYGRE